MKYINEDCLRGSAEKANELAEQYRLNVQVPHARKSVDDLRWVFESYFSNKIVIRDIPIKATEHSVVRGLMLPREAEDGKVVFEIGILLDDDENRRRFVTCKEFFQVALDEEAARNMNLYDHIAALFSLEIQAPTKAVMLELMAEVAAMQFLYPYADRINDCKRITEKTFTTNEISTYYGIPKAYVEKYLSKNFMDHLRASHSLSLVKDLAV